MSNILLLEDDLSLINGLSFAFKKQGFELVVARTLKEADSLWVDGKYDLLVLDVSLPDGTGFEFCKKVRQVSKVPIIFLTAADEEMNIIMGLDIGGDDYITKPFKLGVLVSRVNALLRRAKDFSSEDTQLESNGMKVLLLQGQAFKNGKLLDLTAAEYKLLCLFMKNPNMVLTKEQILDKLWDCDGNYIDSSAPDSSGNGIQMECDWVRCPMKIFANKEIKKLFLAVSVIWVASLLLTQGFLWLCYQRFSLFLLLVFVLSGGAILEVGCSYFKKQNQVMEQAVSQINAYLDGNHNARIECDDEGELYRLFHTVNAHADNELREKEFLKNTISDISHQLKTPLAALNIYNGLLQDGDMELSAVKEFADLSEQELDRIETLVQNLLKITKLDAGAIVLEKATENVADMMRDIELHFAYRARQEKKKIILSGSDYLSLFCDRDWLSEAIDNIVKNAFDHTENGAVIGITWRALPSGIQIVVKDNGCGIHPEDIYHIFKRFYRSRFSKDTQGIGLGLPLAKAVIEAHGGAIEVDSELGRGTSFTINFLIPTKL